MDSASAWKAYYAAERRRLGGDHMRRLLDAAEPVPLGPGGATVIPHTRLEITGHQIAAAVNAVVDSGADRVVALGVLHGARRRDAAAVAAARAGDASAVEQLRGIHDDDGLAAEEFSLDAFTELLALAAGERLRTVEVVRRYPFLAGADPTTLPGLDEVAGLVAAGAVLVVTTDPVHHGHAYDTPPGQCLGAADPGTLAVTRAAIEDQLTALSGHRFGDFQDLAARHRSDFRDTGPVMATLVGTGFSATLHDLALVDYSDALDAPPPSWVAGALVSVTR